MSELIKITNWKFSNFILALRNLETVLKLIESVSRCKAKFKLHFRDSLTQYDTDSAQGDTFYVINLTRYFYEIFFHLDMVCPRHFMELSREI